MHHVPASGAAAAAPMVLPPSLQLNVENGIAVLTINRPEKRNALTLALWRAIGESMSTLGARADIHAIVLTGTGDSFCAGADISEFDTVRATEAQVIEYELAFDTCCDRIEAVPKPTIACINGFCLGGGMNLAMSCDFRYAVPSAQLSIPAARLCIVYGQKGTRRLYELVGVARAKQILYSGQRIDAREAHRIGLVDEVDEDIVNRTMAFAAVLAESAPLSIRGAKALLNHMASHDAPMSAEAVQSYVDEAAKSWDYAEGRSAFAERRSPRFRGS